MGEWLIPGAAASLGILVSLAVRSFLGIEPPVPADTGERGVRWRRARERHPGLVWVWPLIGRLAILTSALPGDRVRAALEHRLERAGWPLGLDPGLALGGFALCAIGGALVGAVGAALAGLPVVAGAVVGFVGGLVGPFDHLGQLARERLRRATLTLPQIVDLLALAMAAGLDFPRAVAEVARQLRPEEPLAEELSNLNRRLALGWSRRAALTELAARLPSSAVRQVVTAVIQADQRGTPLCEILTIQANVLRARRTEQIEQAAARAAVLLLGPLMLIFVCAFLVLLGPFVVKAARGELF